jgi:hypothetical protein
VAEESTIEAKEKPKPIPQGIMFILEYTTLSIELIVALRSVNKIFPESYGFAARVNVE